MMNIVNVYGGLGNQFFQYAFGRVLSIEGKTQVKYNINWYDNWERQKYPRQFILDKFNTSFDLTKDSGLQSIQEYPHGFNVMKDRQQYQKHLLKLDNTNFKGYWQHLDYYNNHIDVLRNELTLKDEYRTPELIDFTSVASEKPSVSVHVRRGDYLIAGFPVLPFSWYYKAINQVEGDIFVFSDDIRWCMERFKPIHFDGRPVRFIQMDDYQDFEIMRRCKNNILSYSTFSWWAAFLNNHPDKTVIAPKGLWIGNPETWFEL